MYSDSAKAKGPGLLGSGEGRSRYFFTALTDNDCQGFKEGACQQTKEREPPSTKLLFIFLKALTGSSKNITPNREKHLVKVEFPKSSV